MDPLDQLRVLKAAQGNPALIALATVDFAHHALPDAERERIKDALRAAAVPHWFDREFLTSLLSTSLEESGALMQQLQALTVVESFAARGEDAFDVHEATRLALREHVRTTAPDQWHRHSAHARAHVANSSEPHARIEAIYHHFAVDQNAAATACDRLQRDLTNGSRPEAQYALALALDELVRANWLQGAALVEARLMPLEVRHWRGETAQLGGEAREILTLAQAANHRSGIGRAQCLLGDVARALQRYEEAEQAFLEYVAVATQLAEERPDETGWQFELANAHARLANLYLDWKRPDDALAHYQRDLSISQHLAAMDPLNDAWQRGLSIAYTELGSVFFETGRLEDALRSFQSDLAIAMRLTAKDPANTLLQQEATMTRSWIANIYSAQGRLLEAHAELYEGLLLFQRLAAAEPGNVSLQHKLALAYHRLGVLLDKMGDPTAQPTLRTSVEVMERAVGMSPGDKSRETELETMRGWLRAPDQGLGP